MRNTFTVLFYLKKNQPRKDGKCSLFCRVTVCGESFTIATHIWVERDRWLVKEHRVRGRRAEDIEINELLERLRHTIYAHYYTLLQEEGTVSASLLKRRYKGETKSKMLLEAFENHNQLFFYDVGVTRSKSTYNKYRCVGNHLRIFLCQYEKREDIRMCDVDLKFIKEFELYLRNCGCSVNTISVYMLAIRKIFNSARRHGNISYDPFVEYHFGHEEHSRVSLSMAELNSFAALQPHSDSEELVRDIFLFSCFTGLSYIDIKFLTYRDIHRSFDNHLWVVAERHKTKTKIRVRLLDAALVIIDKYRSGGSCVFSVPSNKQCNKILKRLLQRAGITICATFHSARHTFATTVALANGVPIESISTMLGHTNIRTTQIYTTITDQKLSKDMEHLAIRCRNKLPYPSQR